MVDKTLHWYAFRTLWNSKELFLRLMSFESIETYIPERISEEPLDDFSGRTKIIRTPVIPGLVFIRTTAAKAKLLQCDQTNNSVPYKIPGTTTPAPIPDKEMEQFQWIVRTGSKVIESVDIPLNKGERVRITGGPFAGATGRICRVHGNRRFVVDLAGITTIATTYIPRCYIQKLEDTEL